MVEDHIAFCAESLQVWNKRKHISRQRELGKNLEVIEMFHEGNDKYSVERIFEAQIEYNKALIREDSYWKQRAKMH